MEYVSARRVAAPKGIREARWRTSARVYRVQELRVTRRRGANIEGRGKREEGRVKAGLGLALDFEVLFPSERIELSSLFPGLSVSAVMLEELADGAVVVDASDRVGQESGDGEDLDLPVLLVRRQWDRVRDQQALEDGVADA